MPLDSPVSHLKKCCQLKFPVAVSNPEHEYCFEVGKCKNSFLVFVTNKEDEFACLDLCKSNPDCQWVTFFKESR